MGKLFLSVLLLGALLLTSCQSIPAPEPNVETAPTPSIQAVEVEPTEAVVTPEPTQGSPEAEDSNEAAAPVGGSAIQGSAIDDILSALLKLRDQQSFRVETTLTYDDYTETSLVEIVNPDRMRLISEDFEMIIIGDTMYVYDEGQWLEFPRMVENMDNLLLMVTDEDVEELREACWMPNMWGKRCWMANARVFTSLASMMKSLILTARLRCGSPHPMDCRAALNQFQPVKKNC
jgi:hypothetical protein